MNFTRRDVFALTAGVAVLATGFGVGRSEAAAADADKAIMEFTGGAKPQAGRIDLTAPEIAENGNTVPVSFDVESPMSAEDFVVAVMLLAQDNPSPEVATFHFTPMSGAAAATTRMRLARTQNVVAIAKMSDGTSFIDTKQVKVTIGGCGG